MSLWTRLIDWLRPDPQPNPEPQPDPQPPADKARALVEAHNKERTQRGYKPLARNTGLDHAAQKWAQHMADTNRMTHGVDFAGRISAEGVSWTNVGENIAFGYGSVNQVMQGWMNSRGHKANILGAYNAIGIGIAATKSGTIYWCTDFAQLRLAADINIPFSTLRDMSAMSTHRGSDELESHSTMAGATT